MCNNVKYLIKLTPIGSYYFGGERSFAIGKTESDISSYIVESNLFPQQTSLLGMLRFWILKNRQELFDSDNNCIIDKANTVKYIGDRSFCADTQQQFGIIKNIDFCFLQKQEDTNWINILPSPLDYKLDIDFSTFHIAYYNEIEKKIPVIHFLDANGMQGELYNYKDGLVKRYISDDGNKVFLEKEIFIKDSRIGIDRNIETGLVEDKAFYKQICYRLADGFRFAFFAEFDDKYTLPPSGQIVELGGDSSKFVLEYEHYNSNSNITFSAVDSCFIPKGALGRVILLSDSRLNNKWIEDYTIFSISEHIPFEFLKFEIEKVSNYSRSTYKGNRSDRYSLFKRGSVFYFDNLENLEKFEKNIDNIIFKNVGYNQYQTIK